MEPNQENKKPQDSEEKEKKVTPPAGSGGGADFLSDFAADMGDFLEGAVEGIITDQPSTGDDNISSVGGKIELKIDEDLDSAIDEESKMFLADKHFRANEYYEALIPALELNIRVRQGRSKRDDVLVKRQDEIIFESNYQLGKKALAESLKAKGLMSTHYRLMALLHLYGAIDQRFQAGQETKRKELTVLLRSLISGTRLGQFFMKTGMFSKLPIPAPEDNGSKAEFWSYLGLKEPEILAKEMYMLMAYSYDLSYFRYQVRLAQYYVDNNKIREGIRYIQISLAGIEEDGVTFLQALKKKSPTEFDSFLDRGIANDTKKLKDILDSKGLNSMFELANDWRRRINNMKSDVPYKTSTFRIEYLKAISQLIEQAVTANPTAAIDSLIDEYKRTILTNKTPIIQDFVFVKLYFNLEINDKSKTGMNVYEIDTEGFTDLIYAVEDYIKYEAYPDGRAKSLSIDTIKASVTKHVQKFDASLKRNGLKLSKEPRFTK